jgi:uncharacterized membrane protein YphA (DoxX/SURF4 family)
MNRWFRLKAGIITFAVLVLARMAGAQTVYAHEKWFANAQDYPLRFDLLFRPLPLTFIALVALATAVGAWLWRQRGKRDFVPGPAFFGATSERLAALYSLVPLILGIHIAVPLLVNGVQGQLFSPNISLRPGFSNFLGLAQTFIALALFYGAFTRLAALGLAALWVVGLFVVDIQSILDNIFYLGFAGFFFLAGRGPISVDRLALPRLEPPAHLMRYAVPVLRTGLGLSFIVVAFTEKFANIPLAEAFLQQYPLNFTQALGIPLPNEIFILMAGSVELIIGLWLAFGIFPREIVLLALVPINLTLTIFNWTELIGHLPIYGAMSVILIYVFSKETEDIWVKGLREGPLSIQSNTSQPSLSMEPSLSQRPIAANERT